MAHKKAALVFPSPLKRNSIATLAKKDGVYWENQGRRMAISLFAFVREHVPAYRKHLQKSNFALKAPVRTMRAFENVPPVTKDGYLRMYPYPDLFPPLGLHTASTVSATSGSTGEPFFFPRGKEHDRFYERSMHVLLTRQWDVGKRSTLCIIGFGFGIWIGGIFTYKIFNKLAESGLPMTLIPTGTNKDMFLRSFKQFARHYDQVILMGYPPFLKDVLDAGREHGVNWSKHRLRILTAAEGYSERFRNYLADISGADPVRDMVNIYGTVEQGTIAHETALANMVRRIAYERKDVFKTLFPEAQNIPTLAQYYPDHVYFEEVGGQLVATGYGSSIPLVRYAFNDLGGVIRFNEMREKLMVCGVDLKHEAKKYGIADTIMPLPFVYVHTRADFVIVFRGANIYPEEIRNALDTKTLQRSITGRFVARRSESTRLDPILEINVELRPKVRWTNALRAYITDIVMKELIARNSEYAYLHGQEKEKVVPHIVGHQYGDPKYFGREGKQKWVR